MSEISGSRIFKADESHSEELTQFLAANTLPALLRFSPERQKCFFNKYRLFSDDFSVYMQKDKDGEILGCAAIMFAKAVIEGEPQTIGYATDLRIQKKRSALIRWSEEFMPVIQEERREQGCKYIFSSVGKTHIKAYNAFIRPRSVRRNFPRYHQFRNFSVVGIHGRYPFSKLNMKSIKIHTGTEADIEPLQKYIGEKQRKKPLYLLEKSENLVGLFQRWPGLGVDNFVIARDSDENIIGCCALWDPSHIEKLRPVKKSKRVITLESTLEALSYLGITRPLSHKSSPYLLTKHINFLHANNPDIFNALLNDAYERTPKTHFLTYLHFENQRTYFPSNWFLATKTSYSLYCLLAPQDPVPSFLKPTFIESPPDFEVSYL